ncbi:MAG: DNRLRE domain-containing protein, partial [Pirellulales bacterium]|nr:DNRLRE domain-containing protein [Pirellulales bacterium]
ASGLIEVKYLTGARVVIEGPAEFTVGSTVATAMPPNGSERVKLPFNANGEDHSIDENGGFLRLGKLVARCDTPESKGFTIHTPIGAIEDLGTEFGVYVRDDESAHVTVLDGEVRVTPQAGLGGDAMVLGKGDRAELRSSGGQLVSNRAVAVNFVRRAPVAGDEGVLIAAVDTRIASGAGRPNTMHDDYLSVFAEGNRVQHSLICFDLESVPADRTIEYAELVLTRRTSAPQPQPAWSEENVHRKPMHVFRIVSAWDEAQVTWNRATTNRKWLSSGGDAVGVDGQRFAQPYATSNDNPAPGEKVRWNVTRLVAQWHRGDVPNHGLLLVSPPTNHLHFYSREYHKPGMRPRLVIKLALKQKASTNEEAKSE